MNWWTRVQMFGCAHNLFHIGRDGWPHLWFRRWDGCEDCFCSFWDAA